MDKDEIFNAFYEPQPFEEVEGGKYDDNGFYRLPGGDYYDPDGVYFDKDGKDKYGGFYDKEFNYHPSKEYEDMVQAIQDEHCLLEQLGQAVEEEEDVIEEDSKDNKESMNETEFEDYLKKEKITPTLAYIKENPDKRHIVISFKGMSNNKEDEADYKKCFKEQNINILDIAINPSRLNVRIKTDDEESIINAIKLEGTVDVIGQVVKVYLPFLKTENVGIEDADQDDEDVYAPIIEPEEELEPEPENEPENEPEPKPKPEPELELVSDVKQDPSPSVGKKIKVEGAEEDGFEITEN